MMLLAARAGCVAQLPDFNVQLLDDKNGIRTANAARLIRDHYGFLWILSARHIQRFDGQNARRIETEGENLLDMAADSSGTVWVSSDSGIRQYRIGYRSLRKVKMAGPAIAPLNKLNKLQVTPDNGIWANAGRGLYRYDRAADVFRFHPVPGLEGHFFYRRIFSRLEHQLYLADVHTIFCYDTRSREVRKVRLAGAKAVVPVTADIAWASNSAMQSFELNFATGTVRQLPAVSPQQPDGAPQAELISITSLTAEKRLVNTSKGCFLQDVRTGSFRRAVLYESGKPLANDENYADFADRDGTHWILGQEGIVFFRPLAHTIGWLNGFPGVSGGVSNQVRAITEDAAGNVWLGTGRGIAVLDAATGKVLPVHLDKEHPARFSEVKALAFDGRNLIVAAGGALPQILDPVRKRMSEVVMPAGPGGDALRTRLREDVIATIVRLPAGDHLLIGELGCYRLARDSYRLSEMPVAGREKVIQTVVRSASGDYWMGTYQGLVITDAAFGNAVADPGFAPGKLVSAILMQNDSTAWCGSVGLYEVTRRRDRIQKRPIFPELANQRISVMHRDRGGRTWIGADDGLYLLNPQSGKLQWFDFRDNIQNKPFNINSLLESAGGRMYIGGLNGLNYFDPGQLKQREEKLNVVISAVRVNQNDTLLTDSHEPLQLDWTQDAVEIQFVTPYFRNPEKLMYRYRLAGLDDEWVDNARSSRVRFTSLPPGTYTFTVAASLDGLVWSEMARPLRFAISQPWWRTWWFIGAIVAVCSGLAYWLFRKRVEVMNRRTALREHMAELEMRALRAQMNPHFIFNCLNSINRYIVKSDNATASLYLTRFAKLIRLILDNSTSKKVLLSNELEALKLYIEMERIRFDNKFDYRIIIDGEVNADSIEVPSLIIQPYVENAIWHGLLHKEDNGSLWVRIRMQDEATLECTIEDNGVGREKAGEYRSKSATGKKSLGMKLTEDRIAVLNQYARTNASVEIIDLEDDNRHAMGTRVVVTIPV